MNLRMHHEPDLWLEMLRSLSSLTVLALSSSRLSISPAFLLDLIHPRRRFSSQAKLPPEIRGMIWDHRVQQTFQPKPIFVEYDTHSQTEAKTTITVENGNSCTHELPRINMLHHPVE